jgi:putative spermidine/putrescine transport system permease protein
MHGRWRSAIIPALAWMVLLFFMLPSLVVFPLSLADTPYLSLPRERLSLAPWINLFTSAAWLGSIGQSTFIALAATAIATSFGTLCAIGCWRLASGLSAAVRGFMLLPLIVPTIVYALGLYRMYVDLHLLGSYTGVIIAHAVIGIPYVIITVSASLANFDPRLEQAASNLGASNAQTLRMVVMPNILPGIISGAIFAFVHSWDEIIIVLFIASRRIVTLPRMIWNGIQESLDPTIAAVAAALVCFTIVLLVPLLMLRRNEPVPAERH